MAGISDRLREIIGNGSVNAFAKKCAISGTAMRQYLEGSVPSADKAARIADAGGVSLVWFITGTGPKRLVTTDVTAEQSVKPDPDLLGRIVDRIAKIYREENVHLPDVDLGRMAAERYAEILEFSVDPDEWTGFLEVIASRVRKAIRAARTDPGNVKHRVSGS